MSANKDYPCALTVDDNDWVESFKGAKVVKVHTEDGCITGFTIEHSWGAYADVHAFGDDFEIVGWYS